MSATSAEWNARHRAASAEPPPESSVIVRELLPLLPDGPALDIACGRGRNTLFLAERGRPVTALDWSSAALDILEERAGAAAITVKRVNWGGKLVLAAKNGIETACADLNCQEFGREEFSLVLCINYLQRSLFPRIAEALRCGGALLYETYTTDQQAFAGGPRNPEYLLSPGELHDAFPELETVFYRELRSGQGTATLLAHKCAP
ncbi:MAG TPA: methyltransferase domain-containing protein [Candidatus Acidoferrum sp.]|nr:methyltransferase domain-containing protein [Candidatus Acidoferrum sp.]